MNHGRTLTDEKFPKDLDWKDTQIVLVTGEGVNTCGHVLLYVRGGYGHYFHFDGPSFFDIPRYLDGDAEYRQYLRDSGKTELLRKTITIPHSEKAEAKLRQLMSSKWRSLLIKHNCVNFAEAVISAGGNFWTFPETCPVLGMGLTVFFEDLSTRLGVNFH